MQLVPLICNCKYNRQLSKLRHSQWLVHPNQSQVYISFADSHAKEKQIKFQHFILGPFVQKETS